MRNHVDYDTVDDYSSKLDSCLLPNVNTVIAKFELVYRDPLVPMLRAFFRFVLLLGFVNSMAGGVYAHVLQSTPRELIPSTQWLAINFGKIIASETQLEFENGERLTLRKLTGRQPGEWTTQVGGLPTTAEVFETDNMIIRAMDGSPLCGSDPITYVALWHDAELRGNHSGDWENGDATLVVLGFYTGSSAPSSFHSEGRCLQITIYLGSVVAAKDRGVSDQNRSQVVKPQSTEPSSQEMPASRKRALDDRGCTIVAEIARRIAIWRDSGVSQHDTRGKIRASAIRNGESISLLVGVVDHVYKHYSLTPDAIHSHWNAACLLR